MHTRNIDIHVYSDELTKITLDIKKIAFHSSLEHALWCVYMNTLCLSTSIMKIKHSVRTVPAGRYQIKLPTEV